MRVAVALVGVAVASLYGSYSYFAPGANRSSQLAEVTEILTGSTRAVPVPVPAVKPRGDEHSASARIFSPQQPLLSPPPPVTAAVSQPSRRSDPFGDAPVVQAVQPKNPVSTVSPPAPLAARKPGAVRPATEEARVSLVRDLQRELKRVGCYDGEITGSWGAGSKRAMGAFTDRVNASLPVEEPDYVLLALVQGHANQACGGCPTGQGISHDGRCLPRAILAQNDKKAGRSEEPRAAVATTRQAPDRAATDRKTAALSPAEADRRLEQRAASLAGQLSVPAPMPARPRSGETGLFPSTGSASVSALPPAVARAPGETSAIAAAPPAAIPGRMSIGAPIQPLQPVQPFDRAPPARTAALPMPADTLGPNGAPGQAWDNPSPPPPDGFDPALRNGQGKSSTQRRSASRQDYNGPSRVYYAERAPPPQPSRSHNRGVDLRSSKGIKDFFFGPGSGSF